ncbi:MAG: alpha/beta fold hydrolase [Gammaproteobacteria bacterium]|nr:alpha/beta fold hydrolase [Gammaproteobacteria bacterium]MBU2072607.1 alpha/beta fold hydrolase [Gammaproteobacteria bacterium]MBU2182259.1 alpha/beta fold hydrolase [Gammaproteobacteria bacterium]MBU2207161.1 alpha/beta fold hydrolase [Gammaproteobacteria bacterium]
MLLYNHISGQAVAGQAPVVLIHGLFGSFENLGVIERSLSEQFQVVNIDVRNHGRSDHSDEMNYPLMADDLAQTLDNLGIDTAVLLGHSMGGKLAMAFALKQPQRVSKLILADIAPVTYPARHNNIFAGLNAVKLDAITSRNEADTQLAQHIDEAGVRQFLLKSLIKQEDKFSWRFNLAALQANYQQLIGAPLVKGCYAGPVLFIKGGDSDYILPEHKAQIMQLFPKAQAKVIQGTGHWLHAEKPAAFTKLVKDFLLS